MWVFLRCKTAELKGETGQSTVGAGDFSCLSEQLIDYKQQISKPPELHPHQVVRALSRESQPRVADTYSSTHRAVKVKSHPSHETVNKLQRIEIIQVVLTTK